MTNQQLQAAQYQLRIAYQTLVETVDGVFRELHRDGKLDHSFVLGQVERIQGVTTRYEEAHKGYRTALKEASTNG